MSVQRLLPVRFTVLCTALCLATAGCATSQPVQRNSVSQRASDAALAESLWAEATRLLDPLAEGYDDSLDDLFPTQQVQAPRTLALHEPPDDRILHFAGTMLGQQQELVEYSRTMGDALQPAGIASWVVVEGTRGVSVDRHQLDESLRIAQNTGGLVNLALSFGVASEGGSTGTDYAVAHTTQYDARLDEIADTIRDSGVRVLLRIGNEINGSWNGHHPYVFPLAYRKVVERFRARKADNVAFVWCIVPHGDPEIFERNAQGEFRWYPGDDVIDWYSVDVFSPLHFSGLAGHGRNQADRFYLVTDLLLEHARRAGKPVLIGEATPQRMDIVSSREDPRGVRAEAVWTQWFRPFLAFLDLHPEIKAVTMLPVDWRKTSAWPDWGDSRIHTNSNLVGRWRDELSRQRWLHLADVAQAVGASKAPKPPKAAQRPAKANRKAKAKPARGNRR